MLSKHCGRKMPKPSPLRPTYSSPSRYPRTAVHHVDFHRSASVSVSEERQRLSNNDQRQSSSEPSSDKEQKKSLVVADSNTNRNHPPICRNISRGSSNSSQVTIMTTLGKTYSDGNNKESLYVDEVSLKPYHRPLKAVTLGKFKKFKNLKDLSIHLNLYMIRNKTTNTILIKNFILN